jgi:tetratricopeptide (TPR) repeat protein
MSRLLSSSSSLWFPRWLVLGAALHVSVPALAQTPASDTAKVTQLFKSGKAAFGKGDMAEAERLFAEAFALRKSSDIAANLGQSQLEQQKYRKAAENFQWALANLLPSATDAQRKAVETGLARSRAEVALLRLDIEPAGSDVLVGEQNVGKSPIAGGVYVDPGEVIVSVKHEGFVAIDKRVMAAKGTEQAVEISLAPKEPSPTPPALAPVDAGLGARSEPPASPPNHDASPTKNLVPAFIATGVAVAGGVVGVVFTLKASSKEDEANQLRDRLNADGGCGKDGTAAPADCAQLTRERESQDSSRNLGIGAFVVGGAAALAAGYFYWDALARDGHRETASHPRKSFLGLRPTVDVARSRHDSVAFESVKLGVSGTF